MASFECYNKFLRTIKYIKRVSTSADFTVPWLNKKLLLNCGTAQLLKKIILLSTVTFEELLLKNDYAFSLNLLTTF